jgi:WD40 repeat protein
MADELKKRFRTLDSIEFPFGEEGLDRRRAPTTPVDVASSPARRLGVALLALVVGGAGFAFVVRALGGGSERNPRPGADIRTGSIAYSAVEDAAWGLFVVQPDGSGMMHIPVELPDDAFHPTWSPDGSRIAFDVRSPRPSNAEGGNLDVYVVDVDGSNLTRLTSVDGWDYQPAWSPDGSRIAYVHNTKSNDDIWVMNADGSDPIRLTDDPAFDLSPAWSPDARSIAFQSNRDANNEIYVMNADGSEQSRVTRNESFDGGPDWSPDGTEIVFASDRDGPGIYIMAADGSDIRRLTHDEQVGPLEATWSPDGTRIAYTSAPGGGFKTAIYVIDLATGKRDEIVEAGDVCCPTWQRPGELPSATPSPQPSEVPDSELSRSTPHVVRWIDVGLFPNAVAAGQQGVWVSVPDNDGTFGGEMVRLAPDSGAVVQRVPVPAIPGWEVGGGGLAFSEGSVWVAGTSHVDAHKGDDATLVQIDGRSGEISDVFDVGGETAADVVVDEAGIWVLVFRSGDTMEVVRIDPRMHEVLANIPVQGIWGQKITSQGGAIWVETKRPYPGSPDTVGASMLSKIDPSTNEVSWTMEDSSFIESYAVADDALWVQLGDRGTHIQRIDPRTNEVLSDVDIGQAYARTIAVDHEGGLWVHGHKEGGSALQRLDPSSGGVVASVTIDKDEDRWSPVAYAYDPRSESLWIANYEDVVSWVDLR